MNNLTFKQKIIFGIIIATMVIFILIYFIMNSGNLTGKEGIDELSEEEGMLDIEDINEMIEGSKYFKNEGDIENKKRTYINLDGVEEVAPHAKNYILKHPILYKMINQKAGYLLRKKPTIKQVIGKNEKEDEDYKEILKDLFNNKMHKRLKYTLIEAVKRGISWWQIYIDKDGDLKARLRYATRIIPLWQDEEHEILDAIIMTYEVEVYTSETDRQKKTKVEYWDLDGVRYYIYDGSSLIEDIEEVENFKI